MCFRLTRRRRAIARRPLGLRLALPAIVLLAIALVVPAAAGAASTWQLTQLPAKAFEGGYSDQAMLSGVSCPTDSLCVAVGSFGTVATSTAPTGGGPAWHVAYPTAPGKGAYTDVSCPTEGLCVAVGFEGSVLVSTDPTGGASAWSLTNVNVAHDNAIHLTGVSCPSTSLCVAVNGANPGTTAGKILSTTDPTGGVDQWQVAQLDSSLHFTGVSCTGPTLCVAVARGGQLAVSSDPTGGAAAWNVIGAGSAGDLEGVDCVATLCAAGNATGNILTSTDPTGGGPWSEAKAGDAALVTSVSCPTTAACLGVDNNGSVFTSTDPTGGSSSWHGEDLVPFEASKAEGEAAFVHNALFGASCASTSLCALVGSDSRIFTSSTAFAGASPGGSGGGKPQPASHVPLRPKAFLFYAENFWRFSVTHRRRFRARFHFYSPTQTRGFECKRDRGRWRRCHSPLRYWAGVGHHALRVRAIGPTGLRGEPALRTFRIVHRRAHRAHRG
jgi:hypothetical protein